MPDFVYQPIFEHGEDATEYRRLEGASEHVSVAEFDGREILKVGSEALRSARRRGVRRCFAPAAIRAPCSAAQDSR